MPSCGCLRVLMSRVKPSGYICPMAQIALQSSLSLRPDCPKEAAANARHTNVNTTFFISFYLLSSIVAPGNLDWSKVTSASVTSKEMSRIVIVIPFILVLRLTGQ